MDEDISGRRLSKRAAGGVDRVDLAQDLAEPMRYPDRLPAERSMVEGTAGRPSRKQPGITVGVHEPDDHRNRKAARQPGDPIALTFQVRGPLDIDCARLAEPPPHSAGPAEPGKLIAELLRPEGRLRGGSNLVGQAQGGVHRAEG